MLITGIVRGFLVVTAQWPVPAAMVATATRCLASDAAASQASQPPADHPHDVATTSTSQDAAEQPAVAVDKPAEGASSSRQPLQAAENQQGPPASDAASAHAGPDPPQTDGLQSAAKGPSSPAGQPAAPQPARLRSLAEIFQAAQQEQEASIAAADLSHLVVRDSAGPGQSQASTSEAQQEPLPRPGDRLISQQYGYAAISGTLPKEGRRPGDVLAGAHPRLLPQRMFVPGQTYQPEELNPYSGQVASGRRQRVVAPPASADVQQLADYKNIAFLEHYLTPAGKLVSRRVSRLPVGAHVKVMREIKRARHMGFIAGEARPEKRHLKALREAEARLQQQAASAGSMT